MVLFKINVWNEGLFYKENMVISLILYNLKGKFYMFKI